MNLFSKLRDFYLREREGMRRHREAKAKAQDEWLAWYRTTITTEKLAKERTEWIGRFGSMLLAGGALPVFNACMNADPADPVAVSAAKAALRRTFNPEWHDGDIVNRIATAAWASWATARYGEKPVARVIYYVNTGEHKDKRPGDLPL